MTHRLLPLLVTAALIGGCASSRLTPPSLAPRAAERIDPRLPVERTLVEAPLDANVRQQLTMLLDQARRGDTAFQAALGPARRAVSAAGAAQGERWITAQQLLSALEAARAPTATAVGGIDAIAGEQIKARNGIASADLEAVQAAAAEAGAIDRRQSAAIAALQAQLGSGLSAR